MKKLPLVALTLIIWFSAIPAIAQQHNGRTIEQAGIVVDATTLQPLEGADILYATGKILGKTDANGYFDVKFNITKPGEIKFRLIVRKSGFKDLADREHWGNLSGEVRNTIYFGLRRNHSASDNSFAELGSGNSHDLSYNKVKDGFVQVRRGRLFEQKLAAAKAGNQRVFIMVDGTPYLADDSGWIKLSSANAPVSVDNKMVVPADRLNTVVKRKDVKGMSPVKSASAQYVIYTRSGSGH